MTMSEEFINHFNIFEVFNINSINLIKTVYHIKSCNTHLNKFKNNNAIIVQQKLNAVKKVLFNQNQ